MKRSFLLFVITMFYIHANGQQAEINNWYKFQTKDPRKSIEFQNTQSSQSELENAYDVNFYRINLNVSSDTTFIKGNVRITAHVLATRLDTMALELIQEMKIDSAFINNNKLSSWTHIDNNLLIALSKTQEKGSEFTIKIFYHGQPPSGGFFAGVTHAHNKIWNKDVTWTLSEPFAAKEWFPVKQSLKDKADSAWIFLTTPPNEMAGSEGILTKIVNLPDGQKRYEWKTHYPIDYYLLSFAVADYQDYQIYAHPQQLKGDSVLIQNFVYNNPNFLTYNKADIDKTANLIELYSNLFSLYPFSKEKYGHCLTELGGGMEHQTMTTIGGFGFDLVAHELGHMWFGDNVTCATWNDIWVNEGFATYADYLANEYLKGAKAATDFIVKAQNSAMSQPGGSIYVPENEIYPGNEWRIFNGRLSYDKGAAILHMLRHEINDDSLFFNVLKAYQKRYGGGVATGKDFELVADSVTGKDFSYFFKQWYYGEGYPIYDIKWVQKKDTLYIESTQNTSTETIGFFKMYLDVKLTFENGIDTLIRFLQSTPFTQLTIPIKKPIRDVVIDPFHRTLQKINTLVIDKVPAIKNQARFTVFPNPVTNNLKITFDNTEHLKKRIEIFTETGRSIFKASTQNTSITINMQSYPKGIYLLTAVANGKHYIQKIVH